MIIFGISAREHLVAVRTLQCHVCGVVAAQRISKLTRKFTLFFIPLFPVSVKYHGTCASCGARITLERERGQRIESSASSPASPVAPPTPCE